MSTHSSDTTELELATLGRYRIIERIGRGGMGEVWLCEDPRLQRQVAIKTLPMQSAHNEAFAQRFEYEAKLVAGLRHPHILTIHDYGKQMLADDAFIPYMVMPLVSGGSLATEISSDTQRQELLPVQHALALLQQVAAAIDFAHRHRIVHRDIKPSNILLRNEHDVLLADFGIARILVNTPHLTQASYAMGTPGYIAPEQAEGRAEPMSDIYSLAVIAYQLFTGRLPFQGTTALATTMQHLMDAPPSPRQFNPDLSLTFEQVLLQGLAKDPIQRPALAVAFVAQLQAAWKDPSFQGQKLHTVQDMPEFAFQDNVTEQPSSSSAQQGLHRTRLGRRDLLFTASAATVATIGIGSGGWAWWHDAKKSQVTMPVQTHPSARPATLGRDEPSLILTGHNLFANSLAWSPDTNILFSTGADGDIIRWNVAELFSRPGRVPLYEKRQHISMFGSQLVCTLSNDGKQLGFANSDQTSPIFDQPRVRFASSDLTNITDAAKVQRLPQGIVITGISWLQRRYLIIGQNTGPSSNQYRLLALDSSQFLPKLHILPGVQPATLQKIMPQPGSDGSIVALVEDHAIVIARLDVIQKQPRWSILRTIQLASRNTNDGNLVAQAITWSGDGKHLVALIDDKPDTDSQQFVYWNWINDPPHFQKLTMPSIDIQCIAPEPSASRIAVGTGAGEIYLWDLQHGATYTQRLQAQSMNADASVMTMAWSQDGKLLAAGFNDVQASICIWRIEHA